MNLPITDSGERPAGKLGECFYCGNPAGDHKADCVCVRRSVVVRLTVEYVVAVPRSWPGQHIEWVRNRGSWCANNDLTQLAEAADRRAPCACGNAKFAYVREAMPQDHMNLPDLAITVAQ